MADSEKDRSQPEMGMSHASPFLSRKDDEPMLSEFERARLQLIQYLHEGTTSYTYKDGTPYISEPVVRDLFIQSGKTEIALQYGWLGHSDLRRHKRWPQNSSDRFAVCVHAPNRYGLEIGEWYDGVEAAAWLAAKKGTDLPEGQDALRVSILDRLGQLESIKKQLESAGKEWLSLDAWRFHVNGSMDFWLNPLNQKDYTFGWFSLDELRSWGENDPTSPILKVNDEIRRNSESREPFSYKEYLRTELSKLSVRVQTADSGDTDAARLMTIALMGCPFPELVQEYAKFSLFP